MIRRAYKVVWIGDEKMIDAQTKALEAKCNEFGRAGWRLVAVRPEGLGTRLYFEASDDEGAGTG
jgi:hypothetical protein